MALTPLTLKRNPSGQKTASCDCVAKAASQRLRVLSSDKKVGVWVGVAVASKVGSSLERKWTRVALFLRLLLVCTNTYSLNQTDPINSWWWSSRLLQQATQARVSTGGLTGAIFSMIYEGIQTFRDEALGTTQPRDRSRCNIVIPGAPEATDIKNIEIENKRGDRGFCV